MSTRNYNTETTSPAVTTTTKKPLHISIGVNYRGFIKYSNITDISNTLSLTTTKISKYVINVGKLAITSTSSTSTVTETTTVPVGNNQSVTISSTEPATTQTPTPPPSNTSTLLTDTTSYTTT